MNHSGAFTHGYLCVVKRKSANLLTCSTSIGGRRSLRLRNQMRRNTCWNERSLMESLKNTQRFQFRRDVLLYAEDDIGFADLFQNALQKGGFKHAIAHVQDGDQAIAYLKGDGGYADREKFPLPAVVLLDLKMPRVSGFQVLEWIRKESAFPYLPVVVLTVSDELREVERAYKLGANSFLMKPPTCADLQDMLDMLDRYWFQHEVKMEWQRQQNVSKAS
jgi:CheY-like chemotaxis protein